MKRIGGILVCRLRVTRGWQLFRMSPFLCFNTIHCLRMSLFWLEGLNMPSGYYAFYTP